MAVLYRLQKNLNPKSSSFGHVYAKAVVTNTISFRLKPLALQYYAVANLLVCLASCYICSCLYGAILKKSI